MKTAKIRNLFPGGNTPAGFISYYNYIIPPDANRIFILKGGPGTGKSTFMRRMGEAMAAQGYDIEFHHCSSDNNSLDGVVIPGLRVAFIDGTAPHIVDPKHPGCVDEILNLGEYWQEQGISAHKNDIMTCTAEINMHYQRAYRMLRAAKLIYDDSAAVYTEALDTAKTNRAASELIRQIFTGQTQTGAGKTRKLFASAITPDGPVHYLASSVWCAEKCCVLYGEPGTGKSTLLQKVIDMANAQGFNTEIFFCPLDPQKPEHVVIPELDTAITTSHEPHVYQGQTPPVTSLNMNDCLRPEIIEKRQADLLSNRQMFRELWEKTIAALKQSKLLHDQLETYYVPHMNFPGIRNLWEKTLTRLLSYKS